jgi:hypothetical protein
MNDQNQGSTQGTEPGSSGTGCKFPCDKEACIALIKAVADRALAVLTGPNTIWNTLKGESASIKEIYLNYLVVMAAIPAICGFLGSVFLGLPFFSSLIAHIVMYPLLLASVYVCAMVFEKLASTFEGTASRLDTFKLAAYSTTPAYVAGFFSLVPNTLFGLLGALVSLYSLYLLYLGVPVMTTVPQQKRLMYFGASLATLFLVWIIIAAIVGMLIGAAVVATSGGTPSMMLQDWNMLA